jgi:hypothetical protein
MAALQGYVDLPSTSLSTSAKTVATLSAPTNQRVKILSYGFYFDGTVNSATPVQIAFGRINTSSTSQTYTTATPSPVEPECTETFQGAYKIASTGSEPTYSATLKTFTVHPQLGYEYLAPLGQEDIISGGGMAGFQVTAGAAVDVRGYVKIEE